MPIITGYSLHIFRMFCLSYNIHDTELSSPSLIWEKVVKENREVFYAGENSVLQYMPIYGPLPKPRHFR